MNHGALLPQSQYKPNKKHNSAGKCNPFTQQGTGYKISYQYNTKDTCQVDGIHVLLIISTL